MRLTVSVASLVTLALLTACGGGSVVEPQPQAPIAVGPSATESPAESPSFATRALKIPRATAMQTPSPVVATPTSSPSPTPTLAPTAVPATSTPEPEPTESQPDPSPAPTLDVAQLTARGERLVERNNCLGCHSVSGQTHSALTFKGLFGSTRQLVGGSTVTANPESTEGMRGGWLRKGREAWVMVQCPDAAGFERVRVETAMPGGC